MLHPETKPLAALLLPAILLAAAGVATADDRDLLRDSEGSPYAFFILDTSGSMHWAAGCNELDDALDIDPWDGRCTRECPLETSLCQQFDPAGGCVEYSVSYDDENPPTFHVVEVDKDTETGWTAATDTPHVGSGYAHSGGLETLSATFTPTLPAAGNYHVYMYYNADPGNAINVPVTINFDGGSTKVRVDQTTNAQEDPAIDPDSTDDHYNYIGTFPFAAGTAGSVVVETANTGPDRVVVDAVRFAAVADPGGVTCTRTGYRFEQPLCPRGDCYAPAHADDPNSKMFQVKEALYEVVNITPDVNFGFATYEQDEARFQGKHWLYRVAAGQNFFTTELPSADEFPLPGSLWVFGFGNGEGWNCATSGALAGDPEGNRARIGCQSSQPADADNLWEMERARRIPKLGADGNTDTMFWYREPTDTGNAEFPDGQVYRATLSASSGAYGDPTIQVDIELYECDPADCSSELSTDSRPFTFELVTDFTVEEGSISRAPMRRNGFFQARQNILAERSNNPALDPSCEGLEPNDDREAGGSIADGDDDEYKGATSPASANYTHKWETVADPNEDPDRTPANLFEVGDFVPLDWLTTNRELILGRLAPNLYDPTTGDFDAALGNPDFRIATYWNDDYLDATDEADRKLRLKEAKQSAIFPFAKTPLAASLDDFRAWYEPWTDEADDIDVRWECRNAYVVFLTDGNETCNTADADADGVPDAPCTAAKDLRDIGVKTYVVGFSVEEDESSLSCIAEEGGTVEPILPRNKEDLVEALQDIFSQIIPTPKAFTSASIPAQQSSAADTVYLSSFVPLPDESVWPGRIDAFRKPLPLDHNNRPDTERDCRSGVQSECHLWEVGEKLLDQAEIDDATLDGTAVDADVTVWSGELKIGDSTTTRRVIYPQANLTGVRPSELLLFRPPNTVFDDGGNTPDTADLEDLADVLTPSQLTAFLADSITDLRLQEEVNEIIKQTLRPKPLGDAGDTFGRPTYLLGDIFHSNPVAVTSPANFNYFANDLCGRIQPEDVPDNCVDGEDRGYRQFTQQHVWRRRMLTAATNDGQLHFFDAGVLVEGEERLPDGQLREFKVISDGSGHELFSYMPRLTMPVVREQATGDRHIYSLDGTLTVRDVFIDPLTDNLGDIDPGEREWRTVLFSGLREAGDVLESALTIGDLYSGYYALDITQPDELTKVDEFEPWLPTPRFTRPTPDDAVNVAELKLPSCLDFNYGGDGHQKDPANCDYRFPMELWTFTDAVDNHAIGPPFLDEDGNGVRDLGDTWSTPVVGQIALCAPGGMACDPDDPAADGDLITKHVMIFGGGIDPANKAAPTRGNWLYMVDVETGEAIYKRPLEGAAAAPPTVLDVDRDGIFDVIYVATTDGFVYKVDLDGRDGGGVLPDLAFKDVDDTNSVTHSNTFLRVDDAGGWDPYKILKTADGIPIYFAPVAFFIPESGHYGLAVGTGEREDLWEETTQTGRFYVIVDNDIAPPTASPDPRRLDSCETRVPIEDACIEAIAWDQDPTVDDDDANQLDQRNALLNTDTGDDLQGGWVMTFPAEFRMTSPPFVVSTILVFSTFQPEIFITGQGAAGTPTCAQTGDTLSFVIQVQNANAVARLSAVDAGTGGGTSPTSGPLKAEDRYLVTKEFTTAPFLDPLTVDRPGDDDDGGKSILDLIDEDVENGVRQAIVSTFPRGARFNDAFQIAIAALRNSTGVSVYATIPVAIYPADWRDP